MQKKTGKSDFAENPKSKQNKKTPKKESPFNKSQLREWPSIHATHFEGQGHI